MSMTSCDWGNNVEQENRLQGIRATGNNFSGSYGHDGTTIQG